MGWADRFLPLSQFNALLSGCGYEPVALEKEYLVITSVQGICDTDFSDKSVTLNGTVYSWAGSNASYPNFDRDLLYFVVPDEAVENMPVSDLCAAYTLENNRPDASGMANALTYQQETAAGLEESCNYRIQESFRLYANANAGTLIIGALYIATIFVCMALAILSMKTLSSLDDERRRFAVLYCLGADEKMQKAALLKQTGAFFLMPFALPLLMTVPLGVTFGKIYEIWDFAGLSGQKAMETSLLITLVMAVVYALYFVITYRITCAHVVSYGGSTVTQRTVERNSMLCGR